MNENAGLRVRAEEPRDRAAVRRVNEAAFAQSAEGDLVDALRESGAVAVSLVAEAGEEIVGHILFSPVSVEGGRGVVGLGPMAVLPEFQRGGIGSELIREGLERCRSAGATAVVVLGHARYYPRFGFRPAGSFGLRSEYNVPDDVFMALELVPGSLADATGVVRYHPAFSRV